MKFIKHFMAVAMLFTSSVAFAQINDADSYTRVQASFVASRLTQTDHWIDDGLAPKGINLGILRGMSVSDVMPLYFEIGANVALLHSADDYRTGGDLKSTFMTVAVPLNMAYKYPINDKVTVSAHAGLNCKLNLIGKLKSPSASLNLLDKDDMGSRAKRANIFQLGGQAGAGVHLSDFYLGWQFQTDFVNYMKNDLTDNGKKARFIANYITIGYQGELLPF